MIGYVHAEHGLPIGPKLEHLGIAIRLLAKAEQINADGEIFGLILPAIDLLNEHEFLFQQNENQSDIERFISIANFIVKNK